jgi:hypothetical protein
MISVTCCCYCCYMYCCYSIFFSSIEKNCHKFCLLFEIILWPKTWGKIKKMFSRQVRFSVFQKLKILKQINPRSGGAQLCPNSNVKPK